MFALFTSTARAVISKRRWKSPIGSIVLTVGIQSHGQELETALSQIVCEELGIDPVRISVRHGDTESTAFGFGTFASRSMVMAGGAVARASRVLRDKLCRSGAHLLQCDVAEGHGPKGSVTIAEISSIAHLRMHELPPGVEPLLDATEPDAGRGPNPRRSNAGDRHRPVRRDTVRCTRPAARRDVSRLPRSRRP